MKIDEINVFVTLFFRVCYMQLFTSKFYVSDFQHGFVMSLTLFSDMLQTQLK